MMAPGLVNLDFADIRTVMAEMGKAMMGTGEAEGENRAIRAAESAISNPLLEDTSMAGARGLLINITGGEDMTLFEVDQAANRIREEVDEDANIIFGSAIDDALQGKIRVSVVATGIDMPAVESAAQRPRLVAVGGGAAEAMPKLTAAAPGAGARPIQKPAQDFRAQAPAAPALAAAAARAARPLTRAASPPLPPAAAAGPTSAHAPAADHAPLPDGHAAHPHRPLPPRPAAAIAAAEAAPPARAAHRGLFAHQARAVAAPPPARDPAEQDEVPQNAPQPRSSSLFGIVTGAIRRSLPAGSVATDAAAARTEPSLHQEQPEPARASVRLAAGEEIGLDIPAFLRRQSS